MHSPFCQGMGCPNPLGPWAWEPLPYRVPCPSWALRSNSPPALQPKQELEEGQLIGLPCSLILRACLWALSVSVVREGVDGTGGKATPEVHSFMERMLFSRILGELGPHRWQRRGLPASDHLGHRSLSSLAAPCLSYP